MGLLSFLSTLANGAVPPDEDEDGLQGTNPKYGYDRDGYLLPRQQGAPMATSAPAPHSADDITVQGDPWKPRQQTVLGAIADAIASYTDDGTPFKDARDRRNMIEASSGINGHPEEAISRIAKFDPDKAWKLRAQVTDDKRMQANLDRQNRGQDLLNENLVFGRLASAMGTATPQTWGPMREQMIKWGAARNIDVTQYIPEQYDPESINTMRYGAVPVAKQMSTAEQVRNHNLQHGDRKEGHSIARERNQIIREQGTANIGIRQQNADTAGQNADTAERRANAYASQNQGRAVNSPAGPGVVDKSGNQLTVFTHSGKKLLYIRGKDGDHWRFAHQIIDKDEKATGTSEPELPDE